MTPKLTLNNAAEHLRAKGILATKESATSTSLGGGVSNRVIQVTTETDCYVLKQPLENLDVEDDWPADIVRVHNEAAATRVYANICGSVKYGYTPRVVDKFDSDHVVVFSCAPSDSTTWKRDLLDTTIDRHVVEIVGKILGTVHADTANNKELRNKFDDKAPFKQLRVDPYHRTTAQRHPDVADSITNEIDRLLSVDTTLVHGDYSPKNILVTPKTPDVWILDFEVAHWGDPAFDTAFMLNHLFIKSVYNHPHQSKYLDAVESFWESYCETVSWEIEAETVTELAILMLARIDGKSPVEYIERDNVADALRTISKQALATDTSTIHEFSQIVRQESDHL